MSVLRRECEDLARQALASWPRDTRSRMDGAWLELSCDLPADAQGPVDELVRRNGELRGGVKFAVRPSAAGARIELRAEVPLDLTPPAVRCRLDAARAGFAAALGFAPEATAQAMDAEAPAAIDLPARLVEAGWPTEVRGDGSLALDLGVPDAFIQAEIELRRGEQLCTASLAAPQSVSAAGREAMAMLLLRAGGAVRLARPVLPRSDDAPRFEVVLTADPDVGELAHALAALAVACRLFAREIEVVQRSDAIASRVRAFRGDARNVVDPERGNPPRNIDPPHTSNREEAEQW